MATKNTASTGTTNDPASPLQRRNRRGLHILWCAVPSAGCTSPSPILKPRHAARILPGSMAALHRVDAGGVQGISDEPGRDAGYALYLVDKPPQ